MLMGRRFLQTLMFAGAVTAVLVWAPATGAGSEVKLSDSGTFYVAVYPNVFLGPRQTPFKLEATLIVRNTDPRYPITLKAVDYHDAKGKKLRGYISEPLEIAPLAAVVYYSQGSVKAGEGGANYIVTWQAEKMVNRPIVEVVMVGSQSGQGISFRTLGQEITGHGK